MITRGISKVQVEIAGKKLTVGSKNNEEHLKAIAEIVNGVYEELEPTDAYKSMPQDLKPVLLEINIADKLVKLQAKMTELESTIADKEAKMTELESTIADKDAKISELENIIADKAADRGKK